VLFAIKVSAIVIAAMLRFLPKALVFKYVRVELFEKLPGMLLLEKLIIIILQKSNNENKKQFYAIRMACKFTAADNAEAAYVVFAHIYTTPVPAVIIAFVTLW